jgi:peptidoglycan/xylan/chitin deacetylase (PgdA/CDA1 family)
MSLRNTVKYAVFNGLQHLGPNRFLRWLHRRQLLIVTYHSVITAPKDPLGYAIHVTDFEQQIATLSRYFRPISLTDLVAAVEKNKKLPDRAVLITFDDGYRNNLTHASPILRRHGVPAVVHISTGYVGTNRILWVEEIRLRISHWPRAKVPMPAGQADRPLPNAPLERAWFAERTSEMCKSLPDTAKQAYLDRLRELPVSYGEDYIEEAYAFLSWEEAAQLQSQGFEIGSHTVDHPILSALEDDAIERELVESKRSIESRLGRECTCIAYPNGRREDVSQVVIEKTRAAGYKVAFLGAGAFNRNFDAAFALNRLNILGYLPASVFHSHVSGVLDLY